MTDQNLPVDLTSEEAKAVREWATDYLNGLYEVVPVTVARIVLDTVPEPPLPTMNKLPENERYDCHRMQCDVYGFTDRMVIVNIQSSSVDVMAEDGERWTIEDNRVTPRPDLPIMEWPGEKKPAPAAALPVGWRYADHKDHGRVIVTNTTQESDGYVYGVFPSDMDSTGFDWRPYDPESLTYIDQEGDTTTGPDHLAVGTVIESADDPRIAALPDGSILLDRDDDSVTKRDGAWSGPGFSPIVYERDRFAPWTVLHIPKEADQ